MGLLPGTGGPAGRAGGVSIAKAYFEAWRRKWQSGGFPAMVTWWPSRPANLANPVNIPNLVTVQRRGRPGWGERL
jgi:hypothetical protein